jgi:GPH family glycoside/pentoside/hexuronide:cation symporter
MGFMANLGLTLYNALYAYVNIYYVCRGDKNLAMYIAGIMGTINTIMAFLLFPLATPISRFFGKRKGVMVGAALTALGAGLAPLLLTPHNPYLQVIIGSCLIAPVAALKQTLISAINPDIYDVDELATGQRREGLFGAVSGFIGKTEFSVCQLLGGYLVVWSGFNQNITIQTPETLNNLRWFAFAPYILFSILAMYFAWRFPITEAMMAETRRKLDARHAAALTSPAAEAAVDTALPPAKT